jgi:RNA-directed DNA polymerase
MRHVRDRIRELTDRRRLLLPVEAIVADVNAVLRGWAGYFRFGNSARHFDKIRSHALERLALVIAKRHHRSRAYGWSVAAFQSPNQLGLIDLNGIVVAPRPGRDWRGRRSSPTSICGPQAGVLDKPPRWPGRGPPRRDNCHRASARPYMRNRWRRVRRFCVSGRRDFVGWRVA